MLGPIFAIEMVTSARRTRYFMVRVLYAVALLFALFITYQSTVAYTRIRTIGQAANVAGNFFYSFSTLQLLAVVMVGPAMAAGTIAVERERRTIEYLFATDLTNREIVLGKLASRLLQIGYLLLAGLPVLALAMLMGGIAPQQLLAVFIITLATMVTVAVLAVTVSVWSPRVRDAITRVYVILFALLVMPSLIVAPMLKWLQVYDWVGMVNEPLIQANPFVVMGRVMITGVTGQGGSSVYWDPVWQLVFVQGVATVTMAALATWAVRRVHLKEAGKAPTRIRPILAVRRRQIGRYPMIWKEMAAARSASRLGIVGRVAMWLIVLGVVGPAIYWFVTLDGRMSAGATMMAADFLACGALLLVAGRAAGSITTEREKDTWVSLLSTPLTAQEIIVGKLVGSLHAARGLVIPLGILWGLQVLKTPEFIPSIPFTLVTLAIVAFFAAGLGVNYSLRCANSTRAMGATLATAVFVAGGYLFCCAPMMIGGSGSELVLAPCIPFLIAFPASMMMQSSSSPRWESAIVGAYAFGVIGYLIAGAFLFGAMTNRFDEANGRIADK